MKNIFTLIALLASLASPAFADESPIVGHFTGSNENFELIQLNIKEIKVLQEGSSVPESRIAGSITLTPKSNADDLAEADSSRSFMTPFRGELDTSSRKLAAHVTSFFSTVNVELNCTFTSDDFNQANCTWTPAQGGTAPFEFTVTKKL